MKIFNKLKSILIVVALSLFVLILSQNSFAQTIDVSKKLKGLDPTIEKILKDWNVPGCGIGIVIKDKLVFAKGYGYRDLEMKLPVTPNTLFQIASNTKLFTATAVGFLVEEGKLDWDKPIKKYVPQIQFYNDELNVNVTIRDMLSHRTGISRHDFIWYKSDFTRQELTTVWTEVTDDDRLIIYDSCNNKIASHRLYCGKGKTIGGSNYKRDFSSGIDQLEGRISFRVGTNSHKTSPV